MRLLHTTELRFEEFYDDQIPRYAILSHRWGPDEVSYQDFLARRKTDGPGYKKILLACKIAAAGGYQVRSDPGLLSMPSVWIWIDTCCIDKASSAELSEAINSMYHWYGKSQVCYVLLHDVTVSDEWVKTKSEFVRSEWFDRGWTLQELLAPWRVVFLDKNGLGIGNKIILAEEISFATGIAKQYLATWQASRTQVTVAEKMTWAGKRKTSRIEDKAYCLLGLFNINMPLLYGEGGKAFRRLQLEILKSSDDESILAWEFVFNDGRAVLPIPGLAGVLAMDPLCFAPLEQGTKLKLVAGIHRFPYSVTNKGLEFRISTILAEEDTILLPLNCSVQHKDLQVFVYAIPLSHNITTGDWMRISTSEYERRLSSEREKIQAIYLVPQTELWSRLSFKDSETEVIYLRL
jgi:hypothetical protein